MVGSDLLKFAILGLGAGAIYGLTALGIVLVYRSSGVLNFAQGAFGMVGAWVFYLAREDGASTTWAAVQALALGAALGAGTHLLVMRPLRRAPALSRLIATLGLFTVLLSFAQERWETGPRVIPPLLSIRRVTVFSDVAVGVDRLYLLAFGVAITVVLWAFYARTRFGLATSAVAENRMATSALGFSPDVISTINWALSGVLAVASAILIVNVAGLTVTGLTLVVVPAMAAALVGGFRSFPLTLAGGLLVGVLESEITFLQVHFGPSPWLDGWGRSVPFLVIIVVLVVRGSALPLRGERAERPPEIGTGRIRPSRVLGVTGAVILLIALGLPAKPLDAIMTSSAVAVIVLSLVVVTGYTGQLSLAQFSLAGMGVWITARLITDWGLAFEPAIMLGVLGAVPIGMLVGMPALRTRGVNLAVATLGLALLMEDQVLASSHLAGGALGFDVGALRLFGIDFHSIRHPERYAILSVVVFALAALVVANLRRGRAGRRLLAVRTNERAAASLGISVFAAKLYAFGLGAGLAALGGILIGLRRENVVFIPAFQIFQSIFVVVFAVIGGIGYVVGAALGGGFSDGGLGQTLTGYISDDFSDVFRIFGGLALIGILIQDPNGLVSLSMRQGRALARIAGRLLRPAPVSASDVEHRDEPEGVGAIALEHVRPSTLELRSVSVRFGGVTALDEVSLVVRPGEVVGLIGPNGAGKTTLCDAVTGFVGASGDIVLDGNDISGWPSRRRAQAGVGRTFQSLELFDSMTVRENIQTACEAQDVLAYVTDLVLPRVAPLSAAAAAAVKVFALGPDLDRRPEELPYGRRRMVAIARAVATGPSVLLLDEPAAGLDDTERAELGDLVRRLAREAGLAILIIEHDVALVLGLCDRVTVLNFGRKIAEGTPAEIRVDPAVIASYLGEATTTDTDPDTAHAVHAGDRIRATARARPVPADGEPCVIEARGLSAGYGDLAAVRGLDLVVRPGEIVALIGPNGAGKTTTLLTLAGELPPLDGEVLWRNQPVGRMPMHRRVRGGLAFVPEERSVFATLSVTKNLRLGRGASGRALELFPELRPLLHQPAGLLSGGEQQILTLARVLAAEPRFLAADELSLGLAPLVIARLLDAVRACADRGVGVLLVEQSAERALEIADRLYVMRRGRVEIEGTAAEVRRQLRDVEGVYLSQSSEPTPG